jgi:hypothetical protein
MPSREVFVRLLNEGTDVWRPTNGEVVTPSTIRLTATPDYDSADEQWQFLPGTLVECEQRTFQGGDTRFVAVRGVNA